MRQRLRMRALSTAASRRGLEPTISSASACSMPAMVGVEEIGRPAPLRIERRAVLTAVEIGDAEPRHQILERENFLDRGKIADDGADARCGCAALTLAAMASNASRQDAGTSRPVLANIGLVEALRAQPVDHVAGLVGNPLLVHVVVDARKDAHDLAPAGIDADGRADGVHDIDRTRSCSSSHGRAAKA